MIAADNLPRPARTPLTPLIPAWLDDLGLTPTEFRVLAHLWRRAGRSAVARPGAATIREACRISDETLWRALASLELRGLVVREKRRYNSNLYRLVVPTSVTPQNRATLLPLKTGQHAPMLPPETGELSPLKTGELLPGSEGYKGIPLEGTHGGVCEGAHTQPAWFAEIAAKHPTKDTDACWKAYVEHQEGKGTPTTRDGFDAWLERETRHLMKRETQPEGILPEPANLAALLPSIEPERLRVYLGRSWEGIPLGDRILIARRCNTQRP